MTICYLYPPPCQDLPVALTFTATDEAVPMGARTEMAFSPFPSCWEHKAKDLFAEIEVPDADDSW